MILKATWVNATRPADQVRCVEMTIRNKLLEMFNGVEHVKRGMDHHRARPVPYSDFSRFFSAAVSFAAQNTGLTPTERERMRVQLRIEGS